MLRFLTILLTLAGTQAQGLIINPYVFSSPSTNPATLPELRYYWVYTDNDTNNVVVTTWTDRVQGEQFGQATGANKPTNTAIGLRFDGATTQLTNTPAFSWGLPAGAGGTGSVWIAYLPLNSASGLGGSGGIITDNNTGLYLSNNNAQMFMDGASGDKIFGNYYQTGTLQDMAILYTAGATNSFYTNGVFISTDTVGTLNSAGTMRMGSSDSSRFLNAYILEIAFYSNHLSAANITALHHYATNTYANVGPQCGSGGTMTAFSSAAVANPLNNFTGGVGFGFRASANRTITQLGRWVIAGNSQTHVLRVRSSSGVDLGNVTVDTSGAPAGDWLYGTLASPVSVVAGQFYYILSDETNGGDQWYNDPNTIPTLSVTDFHDLSSAAVISAYYDGTVNQSTGDRSYGPTNFKFTCP